MLASFRRHLDSWVARAFFLLLVATFVLWGIGSALPTLFGSSTTVANVGGQKIELPAMQAAYQRALTQVTRALGTQVQPTPAMRQGVAAQALEQLITQTALSEAADRMGLGVSKAALNQEVWSIPAFHGPGGTFDLATYQTVLRSNNMTEPNFLAIVRADLAQRQLMGAVRAPVASPGLLTREVYQFQHETRVAEAVDLPFAAAPPPAAPTAAELKRWYENHLGGYSTPEYRRIRAVVLAPETVAKDITVTDAELHAAYDARKAAFNQPEKRTAEVLLAADEAKAQALAKQWQAGADWAVMQKLATAAGASAVELTDATAAEFPAPELAQAVFAAVPDTVPAPVHSALGWHVLKVTKIIPGVSRSFDEMKDQLRAQIVADKAANRIADAAAKLDDLLSGGAALDTLPTDLGLAAVEGTLDSSGNTPEGKPAPIPGSDALRRALVAAAFAAKPGDPPTLTDGLQAADGSQGYFALEVSKITPPAARPFADVQKEVTADWTHDAVVREQNVAATAILTAVKSGTPFAAAAAGLTVRTLPAASRISGAAGVPSQLVEPLFSLKQGEATMVQTADGFTVAVLTRIDDPDPNADPIGFGQVRDALTKALGDDVQSVLTIALRDRAQPTINKALLDSVTQQSQ